MVIPYGEDPSTFGQLWVPSTPDPPLVVLYHGGFWRRRGGDLSLMTEMAAALADNGYAVWNVEYGRTGERFGGWPHTFDHVASSLHVLDELSDQHGIDVSRPVLVGHSAGGHLALWVAAESPRPLGGVIALAPIVDLESAAEDEIGNGAVVDLLGGFPEDVPDRYAAAAVGDLGSMPVMVVMSAIDDSVPPKYSAGVRSEGLELVQLDGVDHLMMIQTGGQVEEIVLRFVENVVSAKRR